MAKASKKAASKKTASKKTASKKTASKKTASKKTASKKTASKKTVSKKTASKKAASKKAASKKTVAKKAPRRAAEKTVFDELDPSLGWSLDEVEPHLPEVPEGHVAMLRAGILAAQTEEQLVTLGAGFRTEDILAAAPTFTVGSLLAVRRLGRPPPGLGLAFFPLLVREARALGVANQSFEQQLRDVASTISGRRAGLKEANSRALAARRGVAQTLLRSVLPSTSEHRAELEQAAAGADTYAATVASVRSVARILTTLRAAGETQASLLAHLGYTEAYVEELLELAGEVERLSTQGAGLTPPQKTDQRTLDAQDGLVLTIMRAIWTPLREARSRGASVRLPPVGALERLFISTSNAGSGTDEEPPASV